MTEKKVVKKAPEKKAPGKKVPGKKVPEKQTVENVLVPTEKSLMELWEKHSKTDPSVTKDLKRSGGFKITTIDAYSQIKEATQEWGPFGTAWGVENPSWTEQQFTDPLGDIRTLGKFVGTFVYPGGAFPMSATEEILQLRKPANRPAYVYVDDEWTKKTFTNALTKALSYLGFNSDVFMGKFDDNRYVAQRRIEEHESQRPKEAPSGPVNMPPKMFRASEMPQQEPSRVAMVASVMSDDVKILTAKIQDYAMTNKDFIAPEALATLPRLEEVARQQPQPVSWLTTSYNSLISAVEKRKAEKEAKETTGAETPASPSPSMFEDDIPF